MRHRGFTLIELMVAVAVLAILLSIGVPAFGTMIDAQRLDNEAHRLMRSVQFTRNEAVRRNRHVLMQPVNGSWTNGWVVFLDDDRNGQHDPDDPLLRVEGPAGAVIHANGSLTGYVRYNSQGESELLNGGFLSGTFSLCPRQPGVEARQLVINRVGRVRMQRAEPTAGNCPE